MNKNDEKPLIPQEEVMRVLNACYEKCLNGIPGVSPTIEDLANEYLKKYGTRELACEKFIKNQLIKCTTSGFLTGFGGIVTIPVTLPVNITSVLYVQVRMIACVAHMAGLNLLDDQTQTFIYACLAGVGVNNLIKPLARELGIKAATALIKKVPGKTLISINKKVGFRLATKFGTKGIVNLGKLVPVAGAVIGGALDFSETKIIASRACKWFFENDFSVDVANDDSSEILIEEEQEFNAD